MKKLPLIIAMLFAVLLVAALSLEGQTAKRIARQGLGASLVVCSSCAPDLLAAKTRGIQKAMRGLVDYCGADVLQDIRPVTFHLDGDRYCGRYQNGWTGNFSRDPSGLGHVCLWEVEKENRALPFTVQNAEKIQDQLLPVHEAMHAWFFGRQENYRIQEPFCKLTSFIISESSGGPQYCGWFSSMNDSDVDVLMKYLCELGMTAELAAETLRQLARSAATAGKPLSDAEFAQLVTGVLGRNAVPAFQSAGILMRSVPRVPRVRSR
jgi:hypothetical protein